MNVEQAITPELKRIVTGFLPARNPELRPSAAASKYRRWAAVKQDGEKDERIGDCNIGADARNPNRQLGTDNNRHRTEQDETQINRGRRQVEYGPARRQCADKDYQPQIVACKPVSSAVFHQLSIQINSVVATGYFESGALIECKRCGKVFVDGETNRSDPHQKILGQL